MVHNYSTVKLMGNLHACAQCVPGPLRSVGGGLGTRLVRHKYLFVQSELCSGVLW